MNALLNKETNHVKRPCRKIGTVKRILKRKGPFKEALSKDGVSRQKQARAQASHRHTDAAAALSSSSAFAYSAPPAP